MTEGPVPACVTAPASPPTSGGVVRNSVAIVAAQSLGNAFRIVATLLLLAALTREDYGALTLAIAFVDPIRSLAVLGVDAVAIRRAAAEPASLPAVVGTLLRIRLVLAAVALAVACAAGVAFRSDAPGGWVIVLCASIGMLPSAMYGPIEVAFQARQRMRGLVLVPTASAVTVVAAVVALWLLEAPLPFFVATGALGEVAAAATAWAVARRELRDQSGAPASFRWDGALARDLLREGLPLAYVNVVVVVYGRVGFLLLEAHGGRGPAADLGAATKLVSPILMLGAAVSVSVAPYATHLAMRGAFDEFRREFRRFLARVVLFLGPLVAVGVLVAPSIVQALKPEYAEAAAAFRWLAFGALAMLVCQISSSCLVGLGHFRAIARFATLNLVVFLAIAVPLAPRMGAEGIAIATFSMEALNAVLQSMFVLFLLRPRG